MNKTECIDLDSVKWTDPGNIISLAILAFINVLVIVGNCLVIAAVFCSHKLRSVTNFFIVSLAVADLLVGLCVLPFSATWEVFKVWIFGDIWCRVWLAVDVWMCTASILNLCAISLDRYVAVTRPVTYPSIMSTKRAKLLVAGVWVLSFVICFPPLVGLIHHPQTPKTSEDVTYRRGNHTLISATTPSPNYQCPWTCELTDDTGYVVYSALGSFYIPMFVMLFFYWRIYRAAVRTTRAINQGFKTTKGSRQNKVDQSSRLTLRIHRGRRSNSVPRISSLGTEYQLTSSKSADTTSLDRRYKCASAKIRRVKEYDVDHLTNKSPILHMMQITLNRKENMETFLCNDPSKADNITKSESVKAKKGVGKRILKVQAKRFKVETKAAKTLAIIVGGFICCWLPFFSVYLIRAFCKNCIEPLIFSILFWLGYCNSAINPLIYALFSKDFRLAFKHLICSRGIGNRFDEQRLTLRIHRGRGRDESVSNGSTHSTTTSIGSSSPERHSKFSTRKHDKIKISVSYPSSENIASPTHQKQSNNVLYAVHYSTNGKELTSSQIFHGKEGYLQVVKGLPNIEKGLSPRTSKKMGKRNIKAQVKRFKVETKAAKTLAIIVGLFILCWLPFFTMYLIRAFCKNCIPPLLFSIMFWLGYLNSAVNPMIYALFSKDFRFAFKRIICKCFCSGPGFNQATSRRGSDMSQLRTGGRTPSISPSAAANSLGDESDHAPETSELR